MRLEDFKNISVSEADKKALRDLAQKGEWTNACRVIEEYIMRLTYNLVAGTELEKGKRQEELDRLAGFVYYWNKIIQLAEKKEQNELG